MIRTTRERFNLRFRTRAEVLCELGDVDVAVAQQTIGLEIVLNDGTGVFSAGQVVPLGIFNIDDLHVGDLDLAFLLSVLGAV